MLKEDESSKIRNRPSLTWIEREELRARGEKPVRKPRVGCPPGWYRKKISMDFKSINERRKLKRRQEKRKLYSR